MVIFQDRLLNGHGKMYFSHNEERVKEKNQHGRMKRKKKKPVLILRYEAFFFTGADSQRVYFFPF